MSWIPTTARRAPTDNGPRDVILANLQRALLLASVSHRLQDSISSKRATVEARSLLSAVKRMCEDRPDIGEQDERIRHGIESLTRALDDYSGDTGRHRS